ncbi:MAG: Zn-ribbon domain-containing OB-fold protein [Kofleriaceae bacterium]
MSDVAKPLVPFLEIPEDGKPYLRGLRCTSCRAVFFDRRVNCASCGARASLTPERMASRGTLFAFSIIHRSFPGIEVPYISAIVDLDGGGTLKGNLKGIEPSPTALRAGMPVELAFGVVPERDDKGNSYLGYHFVPVASAGGAS